MSAGHLDFIIEITKNVEISADRSFKSCQGIGFGLNYEEKLIFDKLVLGLIEEKIAKQHDIIISKSHYIPTKSELDVISDKRFLKKTWKNLIILKNVHVAYQKTCVNYLQKKHFYLPKLYEKIEELNVIIDYIFEKISTN